MDRPFALIVDDHDDSAIILCEAFKMAGFAVEAVRSGDETLARLADMAPDVVILDLWLPHVAGTEILQRIRADARLAKTYVIVISADPILASTTLGLADRVLLKPVGFVWLRDLARRLAAGLAAADEAAGARDTGLVSEKRNPAQERRAKA